MDLEKIMKNIEGVRNDNKVRAVRQTDVEFKMDSLRVSFGLSVMNLF